MALIVSAASGNFNVGATWVGGVVPGVGDTAQAANGHTITITANAACTLINNAGTGTFILSNGVTLTANIEKGNTATPSVQLNGSNSANIVGNVTGPSTGPATIHFVVASNSSGALSITGNITGGSALSSGPQGVSNGAGTLNVTGNVFAGTGGNGSGVFAHGITNGTGTVNVTGGVNGGNGGQVSNRGIDSNSAGTISVVGTVAAGVMATAHAIRSASTASSVIVVGDIIASNTISAVQAGNSGTHQFSGSFIFSENGTVPVDCLRYKLNTTPIASKTRYALNGSGTYVDMFTADNTGLGPATNHVRSGVTYSGMTGTLAVPLPSQVAVGVATDNTVGTAFVTGSDIATAVWGAASRTITGGMVDTLTNPPTVPTVVQIRQEMDSNSTKLSNLDATVSSRLAPSGTLATVTTLTNAPTVPTPSQIASQVRSELSVELGRVDQAISSRLAGSAYTAPANSDIAAVKAKTDLLPASPAATGDIPSANISAIKAKTDLLETTRLAQCSTVATTGAQLAAALS
jgi:hypothetical protein